MNHDTILNALTLLFTVPVMAVNTYFIIKNIKILFDIRKLGKRIKEIEMKLNQSRIDENAKNILCAKAQAKENRIKT